MRGVLLLAGLVGVAVAVTLATQVSGRGGGASASGDTPEDAPAPPTLLASAPATPASQPEPTPPDGAPAGAVVVVDPVAAGLVVTPEPPSGEAQDAGGRATRAALERARPLRSAWHDVPLQELLQQLSAASGLTVALAPEALERGATIRVEDPLRGTEAESDPTVWAVLEAVASRHGFALEPWTGGVLLRVPPDPDEVRLRYFEARDVLEVPWGRGEGVQAGDELDALFPDLVRAAACLEAEATVAMRNRILIVRARRAGLDRVRDVFERWGRAPASFEQAWRALVATRHPTVSGAPPREGTGR